MMGKKNGMPWLHGSEGEKLDNFGELVGDLAQSYPGAVAEHVHMMRE